MPWKESRIMDQRLQFLSSYQKDEMSVADLCRVRVLASDDLPLDQSLQRDGNRRARGLQPRLHSCSHATLEPIENTIPVLRAKHPSWGAGNSRQGWRCYSLMLVWPAVSTFGNILSRAGLTSPQKKRKRTTPCSEPFSLYSRVQINCGASCSGTKAEISRCREAH